MSAASEIGELLAEQLDVTDGGKLTVYPDLIQGDEPWHDQRRGLVTASAIGKLVTPSKLQPADNDTSRGLTALLVAERITGWTDPTYVSDDMLRGLDDEPRAVAKYSEHYAEVTTVGFMVREFGGLRIGFSPDGLVGEDGFVECKSEKAKIHVQTILSGEVPPQHVAQIQCGLLVSGRKWADFVSYCGGMNMWVKRVLPDPRWFAAIVAAVQNFETVAAEMVATYNAAVEGFPMTERIVDFEIVI